MAQAPDPTLEELQWTIACARLLFGPDMAIQAPPNLTPDTFGCLIRAGINDWGGVSPVTPDHVNPEAPWPHLERLARKTAREGKALTERLTVYPAYVRRLDAWVAEPLRPAVQQASDAEGFARESAWSPGDRDAVLPAGLLDRLDRSEAPAPTATVQALCERASRGEALDEAEIAALFTARGDDLVAVVRAADVLRREVNGDEVTYVVNRNINYTNVCYFKCQFCAFSKGKLSENLRGAPYDLDLDEIARRTTEAWERGATEVCMQGGIHPDYTGTTYLDICRTVKNAAPAMHVHAFSPLEVWQGAATLGISLEAFLRELKDAGLGTLPGTAAEVLDDEVRRDLCPDKLTSGQWLEVMETAHRVGFRTTATIMYGHIDRPRHWARHLARIRALQARTGGFTEFVPLPFVHMEAPIYLKGKARPGPDVPRVAPHARGGANGAPSAGDQHPGVVGEDGSARGACVPRGGRERPRRDADEREHHAGRRRGLRPGAASGPHGGAHLQRGPHRETTRHCIRRAVTETGDPIVRGRGSAPGRADAGPRVGAERRSGDAGPARDGVRRRRDGPPSGRRGET